MYQYRDVVFEELGKSCSLCGWDADQRVLQVDHIVPTAKTYPVSALRYPHDRKRLVQELKKCQLLCPNCHAIKSADEQARRPRAVSRAKLYSPSKTHLKDPVRKQCPRCGNPFETRWTVKVYCDEPCRKDAEQIRWRKRRFKRDQPKPV